MPFLRVKSALLGYLAHKTYVPVILGLVITL